MPSTKQLKIKADLDATDADIRLLAEALMRGKAEEVLTRGGAVFLVGAGCSVSAGIPAAQSIAKDCACRLAKAYGAPKKVCADAEASLSWLIEEERFPKGLSWEAAYTHIFDGHYVDANEQRQVIERAIENGGGKLNWAHICLGELVAKGYVHTVLTTNFDQLTLEGIIRAGIIPVVADGVDALTRISGTPNHPQLVHIHGSRHAYNLRNSSTAVRETSEHAAAQGTVFPVLRDARVFVVVGYAGREEGIMTLLKNAGASLHEKLVFWVQYSGNREELTEDAREFLRCCGRGVIISGQDADAFFLRLLRLAKVGVPEWISRPISPLRNWGDSFASSQNHDVQAEIDSYAASVDRLEACWRNESNNIDRGTLVREDARQYRLAGNFEDALNLLAPLVEESEDLMLLREYAEAAEQLYRKNYDSEHAGVAENAYRKLLDLTKFGDFGEVRVDSFCKIGRIFVTLSRRSGGPEGLDYLEQAIESYRNALEASEVSLVGREVEIRIDMAEAAFLLGERIGGDRGISLLREAVEHCRNGLEKEGGIDDPEARVFFLKRLGVSLSGLGRHECRSKNHGKDSLVEAVSVLREGLSVTSQFGFSYFDTGMREALGRALSLLGIEEGRLDVLGEAEELYRSALSEYGEDKAPLDRAVCLSFLGDVLSSIAELGFQVAPLEEAVYALASALKVITRDRDPLRWAMTEVYLGRALVLMSEHKDSETNRSQLERAVARMAPAVEMLEAGAPGLADICSAHFQLAKSRLATLQAGRSSGLAPPQG